MNADPRFLHTLTWDEKALENPLYAVMSRPEFINSGPQPSDAELEVFFADGRSKVSEFLLPWLSTSGAKQGDTILEYGCGMGRLLKALDGMGLSLAGVDISPKMIEHARALLPDNVALDALDDDTIPMPDESVDFVYSYAVFQHIARKSDLWRTLEEISRVMKLGAHFKFQFNMVYSLFTPAMRYAFERHSIVAGPAQRYPVPTVRRLRHSHWGGCRPGYRQIIRRLTVLGLEVDSVFSESASMTWLMGRKREVRLSP